MPSLMKPYLMSKITAIPQRLAAEIGRFAKELGVDPCKLHRITTLKVSARCGRYWRLTRASRCNAHDENRPPRTTARTSSLAFPRTLDSRPKSRDCGGGDGD